MPATIGKKIQAKSIAIIGGGPSGIASLYDLTRALKDGSTLFGSKSVLKQEELKETAFDEIVAFERNPTAGGVWSKESSGDNNKDLPLPDLELLGVSANEFESDKPDKIFVKAEITPELENKLAISSVEKPVVIKKDKLDASDLHQWKSSAAYEELFTNVTNRYMSFSFDEYSREDLKGLEKKYKHLQMFQAGKDVGVYLEKVIKDNDLARYIRTNTNVERVRKLDSGKWEVVVKNQTTEGNSIIDRWYRQEFDAVIIANGKTVPYVPNLKNLNEFAKKNKDKVTVTLAKAIKNVEFISKAKKILFVGASVSAVDLIQYAFPRDLSHPSIYISRRNDVGNASSWTRVCSHAKGLVNKPEIQEFKSETNSVLFKDGTTESDFDVIIIATGYHMYYPFLDQQTNFTTEQTQNLTKFYRYTFSIADPTLALVGNTYAGFFFNRVESQAAALASVWSGHRLLPSVEEQRVWYAEKFPQKLVECTIKPWFIDPLIELALNGRPNPLEFNEDKLDHVAHNAAGKRIVEDLFFKIRDGEVTYREVI
ncbi:unnamed protein product [Ambrosiozyma monospora]|uniref:Unnamed protein product n=1 Tax=Ambrosiozyma monospora TaxID=43982 RepID=A0A9W6Z2G7_AMBMO|nr:unnamed protein product [Ambrosiozyma monospora]